MLRERCWNKSEREERKKERKRGMEKEGKASSWCDILLLQALQEQPWFRSFEDPGEQQQLARRAWAFSRCPLPPTTDFWLAYAGRPDSDDNAFRSLRLWTPLDLVGAKPFFLRFSSFALSLSLSLAHTPCHAAHFVLDETGQPASSGKHPQLWERPMASGLEDPLDLYCLLLAFCLRRGLIPMGTVNPGLVSFACEPCPSPTNFPHPART